MNQIDKLKAQVVDVQGQYNLDIERAIAFVLAQSKKNGEKVPENAINILARHWE
jgi:hypothetical protein